MDQNELSLDPSHLGVPSGVSKMISEPIARSAQTVHQPCLEINTISKRTKMSFHLTRHLGGQSGAAKNISMPVVHSAQTMHLSCAEINTVSKQTEASFHLTHVT
jgi:hypothetical protein